MKICFFLLGLLNNQRSNNKFSISGPNVQMHFIVRSKNDNLEHVLITDQQANQLMITNSNKEMINQTDKINKNCSNQSTNILKTRPSSHSMDGSKLKQIKHKKTLQQHLTLRIFRNFVSSTFIIINSLIGCILSKSNNLDKNTVINSLKLLDPISAIISVIIIGILIYPEVSKLI